MQNCNSNIIKKGTPFLLYILFIITLAGCNNNNKLDSINKSQSDNKVQENSISKVDSEKSNSIMFEDRKNIITLIENDNPYDSKPTMTPKQRYDLRKKIFSGVEAYNISNITHSINSSALQLNNTLSDSLYKDLIDPNSEKWKIYDANNLYGISNMLRGIKSLIKYQPLLDDLETIIKLSDEGLAEKNILKIIDSNRILQDLSRHLLNVPYSEGNDAKVDYGNMHDIYFKATKTLEGKQKLISEENK